MAVAPLLRSDPRHIGPFKLEARLGTGGMGDVFLARGRREARVALKRLRRELVEDEEFRRRFRREVRIALQVDGLCTARVVDANVLGKELWLATEYVDGPTLAEYVRDNGPLEAVQLRALAVGLAEALHAIHNVGVIHRDLTPNNVLVTEAGPKVVDFGIATERGATVMTRTGQAIGTPAWMAPEQVRGERPTPATDVFAYGAVLAFAGLGQPPFGEGRPDAVLYRVVHHAPELHGLDNEIAAIARRCLEKKPAARPTIAELAARLTSNAADELTQAAQKTMTRDWTLQLAVTPLPASRRRRLTALAAAAAVILVVAGAVAAVALRSNRSSPVEAGAVSGQESEPSFTAVNPPTSTMTTEPATTTSTAPAPVATSESTVPPLTPEQIAAEEAGAANRWRTDGTGHYWNLDTGEECWYSEGAEPLDPTRPCAH